MTMTCIPFGQIVIALGNGHGFHKIGAVHATVEQRDLRRRRSIRRINQLALRQKHLGLIILRRDGVIDVRKGEAHGESVAATEDAVCIDFVDGNPALNGARLKTRMVFKSALGRPMKLS